MSIIGDCSFKVGCGALLLASLATCAAYAAEPAIVFDGTFPRSPFDKKTGPGQSVAVDCQEDGADYAYSPYDWPDAVAKLKIEQGPFMSEVSVEVENARPNTLYTLWAALAVRDAEGKMFGGSPLTGKPGTALINSADLEDGLDAIETPTSDARNGFVSDDNGNGSITLLLDYPIVGGAYPFQNFPDFDRDDVRFPIDDPLAVPTAFQGNASGAPYTIRLASHCVDGKSHGLEAGPHEAWFDWSMN